VLWDVDRSVSEVEVYAPALDMYEKEDSLILELELPGLRREDIEVYVTSNTVTVEGVKQDLAVSPEVSPKVSFLRLERKLGRFFREIELPVPCNTRQGEARYERGLLILEFKKIQDRRGQRHRIEVK
jgi:HSP20 family protein